MKTVVIWFYLFGVVFALAGDHATGAAELLDLNGSDQTKAQQAKHPVSSIQELSQVEAGALQSDTQVSFAKGPRVDFSAPDLLVGTIFSTLNFGWGDHFSIGPLVAFRPIYLFSPRGRMFSYDIGIDSNIFLGGTRYSSSWFINPYAYYSGFTGYRVEESRFHLGFNAGYRWIFKDGFSLSLGAGIRSIYSSLAVFSYSPRERVLIGRVQNWLPIAPSFQLTFGFQL